MMVTVDSLRDLLKLLRENHVMSAQIESGDDKIAVVLGPEPVEMPTGTETTPGFRGPDHLDSLDMYNLPDEDQRK